MKTKTDKTTGKAICYRTHPNNPQYPTQYVSHLPEGNADFGYTPNPKGEQRYGMILDAALPLGKYWQRRFAKHCRDCGMTFHMIEI